MPETDINDLILGCINGDKESLSQLVERYSGRLYGFFVRMGYAPDVSEDMVQEFFIRISEKLKKYKDGGQFEAWMFRVAANMARDFSRKKSLKTVSIHITSPDGESSNMELSDSRQKSPDELMSSQEMHIKLNNALEQLTEQEREFIILRHYSQMGFKEIAQECGLPIGTVLSKVHRGLKKLKDIMS